MTDIKTNTVAAISTPIGTGGIAVIRMTGPKAVSIAESVFVSPYHKKLAGMPSHKAAYGWVQDSKGEFIDECLFLVMRGPHTFTGEDTVEINCHGGMYICRRILETLMASGAEMAEPGEFSKRAFLNGRMDLTKAEAVMDMINAQTAYSLKAAVQQLEGSLSGEINRLRHRLLDVIVAMEVNIDYPEYDVPEITDDQVQEACGQIREEIQKLLDTADTGQMLRQGVRVAIVGKPNVGKSSLLNMLLRQQRAIVTDIPGTTRDVLEEMLDLGGIPIRIMDTAGIRKTEDAVEKIGVERAFASMEESDLILFVLDASRDIDAEERELLAQIAAKPHLVLLNKTDIGRLSSEQAFQELHEQPLAISAREQKGLEELTGRIKELFFAGDILVDHRPLVTNVRQKTALLKARESLDQAMQNAGFEQDLLIIDIRQACDALGEVSGLSTQEDVVTEIFSQFCLGK